MLWVATPGYMASPDGMRIAPRHKGREGSHKEMIQNKAIKWTVTKEMTWAWLGLGPVSTYAGNYRTTRTRPRGGERRGRERAKQGAYRAHVLHYRYFYCTAITPQYYHFQSFNYCNIWLSNIVSHQRNFGGLQ